MSDEHWLTRLLESEDEFNRADLEAAERRAEAAEAESAGLRARLAELIGEVRRGVCQMGGAHARRKTDDFWKHRDRLFAAMSKAEGGPDA